MCAEFTTSLTAGIIFYKYFRWFCHFDDDIYVNMAALVATLGKYNPTEEQWYLGRWSVNRKEKIEVLPCMVLYT